MLSIGDDDRAIGELDLIARPAQHDLRRGHYPRRQPVGVEQLVTDRDVTHRGPAGRCGQGGVQRERLAHAWTRRHDDHLSRMQPVGHLVEFGETGRHATGDTSVGSDGVDLVHRRLQQILERDEVLGKPAIGDVVDLRLSAIDDLGHIGTLGAGVAVLHNARPGLHQPTQQRLLRDDARVVAGVGCRRHRRNQGVQVRGTANAAQQPAAVQFGGDRHGVGRLAPPIQIQDGVVDVLVHRPIEVAGPQPLQHISDGVLAQQHPAQHRLLGGQILRWLTAEVFTGRRGIHAGMTQIVDNRHQRSPPSD